MKKTKTRKPKAVLPSPRRIYGRFLFGPSGELHSAYWSSTRLNNEQDEYRLVARKGKRRTKR